MKMLETSTCKYCPDEDNITHFFIFCIEVYNFWGKLFSWLDTNTGTTLNWPIFPSVTDILFGITNHDDPTTVTNYCILYAKSYIHYQRLFHENKLVLEDFLS